MGKDARSEARIAVNSLIGTFDILGAKSIFSANDAKSAEFTASLIVSVMSDSIDGTIKELQSHYKDLPNDGIRLKELVACTSSYFYADTIVFICDVSRFDTIMVRFACEYFQFMAIEITRRMFAFGVPVRGCLSYGAIACYNDNNKIVVSGRAYIDAIKVSDDLEFAGTVLTDEFYKVAKESCKAIDYPPMEYLLCLPCTVKDRINNKCITRNMWCLDWIEDTDFVGERTDVRQLIFDSFTKHGKKVGDSVIGKIDNTETIIRMLIAHRKAEAQ